MSSQILVFLIDTVLGLLSLALLLRFYFQLMRVPFYNPVSQFIIAATDFVVRPARRIIPGLAGMDLPTLVLVWLFECGILISVFMVQGYDFLVNPIASFGVIGLLGIVEIVKTTLYIVLVTIVMQAVLSWVNPQSPMAPLLDSFTRPFLAVFRRRIPPIANVDLSPLFVLILIQVLLMVVAGFHKEIHAMLF